MKSHRLVKGQRIVMGEREYVVEQRLPNGALELKDVTTNTKVARTETDIIDLLFKGHLKLLGYEHAEEYAQKKMAGILQADLSEYSDAQREGARIKYDYVTRLITMGVDRKTRKVLEPLIQAIAKARGDEKPPSYWKIYRWYTQYIESGESPRAFFPLEGQKGNCDRKVQSEVAQIIDESIAAKFLNDQRLTVRAVYDDVVIRINKENELRTKACNIEKLLIPNERAVYRVVDKLDPYEVAKARFGERFANLKFKPRKEGPRPTRPLQQVMMDHTKLDLFVVDMERRMPIGRPWLTIAIDVLTKCIVGIYIGFVPPSYHSVMQCLKHAISPKTYVRERFPSIKHTWDAYGLMEMLIVDNGKEFWSKDLEDACLQIGIVLQFAPVKCPWYKAPAERFFGTLNTSLLHEQPGTTFSNIFEKDEYDSKKNAVISFETFEEMAHKWIIDVYHQDKHKGHDGAKSIPAVVWKAAVKEFPPALPASKDDLNVLVAMIETRKIQDAGIEMFNLWYSDDNLTSIRRQYKFGKKVRVKVKYDPSDLSMIYVQDEFRKTYSPVKAVSQSYTQGLNLWAHQVICRYARENIKKDFNIVDLAIAKAEIWEMASTEWNLTKRTGTRSKLARLFNVGQDDYGNVIEMEKDTSGTAVAQLPERGESATDPILPLPAEHPANGISSIGTPVNSTTETTEDSASDTPHAVNEDIGKGDFVSSPPKKRGRPKRTKTADGNGNGKGNGNGNGGGTTADQSRPAPAVSEPEEEPDLSEWGISYMNN